MDPRAEHRDGHVVCAVADLPPGRRKIVNVEGRSIGIFNVAGRFYALRNRCPHKGGPLCEGLICGTTMPTDDRSFLYGRDGSIVRCAWHGWEFDITTGEALADPRFHAHRYPVRVEHEQVVLDL